MKRILLFLIGLQAALHVGAQINVEDSTVNVVAYFCKNDTMHYTYEDIKLKIKQEADTTVVHHFRTDFMLVVEDSTSAGYRLRYIPKAFTVVKEDEGEAEDATNRLVPFLWEKMKDLYPVFVTDELGQLQGCENWREISRRCKDCVELFLDSLYALEPEMAEALPKERMRGLFMLAFSTERGILSSYEEVEQLLALHGTQYPLDRLVEESGEGGPDSYPYTRRSMAGAEEEPDESSCEGDYYVTFSTTQALPEEDAKVLVGSVALLMGSDDFQQQVSDGLGTTDIGEMTITDTLSNLYFDNGWPRFQRMRRSVMAGKQQQVTVKTVSATYRNWYNW